MRLRRSLLLPCSSGWQLSGKTKATGGGVLEMHYVVPTGSWWKVASY